MKTPTLTPGRLLIVAAAVLWSLSGAFVKLLSKDTALGRWLDVQDPPVPGLVMACYRPLLAGLVLTLFLRRSNFSFRPLMIVMVLCFAAMNALFVVAMSLGSAANAIVLQYTAPAWMFLASVFWLKEPTDRRDPVVLGIAMLGVAVIVIDAIRRPTPETLHAVIIALGSGVTYAAVVLCLRVLRTESGTWLTVMNHLAGGLVLLPILFWEPMPTWRQYIVLLLFGVVQMGTPYFLMSQGLRVVSAQEAGMITLLEPLLNPVWTYLVSGEVPDTATFIGGGLILAALAWRYWPRRTKGQPAKAPHLASG